MGRYLRFFALLLIAAPLTAMFGEPFYEALFDILGVDSETWAAPVVTWIGENTAFLTLAMGVGIGIWIHSLALRLTYWQGGSAKAIDWNFLEEEIERIRQLLAFDISRKDEIENGYSPIGVETFSGFYALLTYLHERGMAPKSGIPDPRMMVDHELFFEIATRYISSVGPYIRAKDSEKVSYSGEQIINLVYLWEAEKRHEKAKSENHEPQSRTETES